MEKPIKKHVIEPIYVYREIIKYIETKYKIKTRDYYGKFAGNKSNDKGYADFWHWVIDLPVNSDGSCTGSIIYIPIFEAQADPDEEQFVKDICKLLETEFGENTDGEFLVCWSSW